MEAFVHTPRQAADDVESGLRRAAGLATMVQRVAVAANEAASLEEAAVAALAAVSDFTGWPVGRLHHVDGAGALRPTSVWHPAVPADAVHPGAEIDLAPVLTFPVLVGTEEVGALELFGAGQLEDVAELETAELDAVLGILGAQLGRVVERERAAAASRRNEELNREIIATAHDSFISLDASGRVTEWNQQAETQFGWTREEVVGEVLADLIIPPEDREAHTRGIQRYLEAGQAASDGHAPNCIGSVLGQRVELEAVDRSGRRFPIEMTAWAVHDGDHVVFHAFIQDITLRKAVERDLEHRSRHDPLTGLANRGLLIDRLTDALEQAGATGTPLALLFVDLDRFKNVNDSLGHDAGDKVLVAVADRVSGALREGDTLARLSGDEFVVLRPETATPEEAAELANRILAQLEEPFVVRDTEAYVSASIGIALATDATGSAEKLLADADLAMYRAKERGKGVLELFDEALRIRLTDRIETERELRRGIQAGELVAYYQPLIDLASRRVVGVEALVRWQHPRRGLLLPDSFIPMAEETGLVNRVGDWMLREACRQMKQWQAELADPPSWVAVNLSVRQVERPGLVDTVTGLLAEYGLEPGQLLLEITESAIMHDAQAGIERLWRLRELGVRISIDDFGTGYSSLNRLRRLPVDSLKVDRSFVADMFVSTGGTALVEAVIAMSHSFGLRVVAEGVETVEQLRELFRLGCDEVQGYLLSRPIPPDQLGGLCGPVLAAEVDQRLNGELPRQPAPS
jgi:diguanylate cyclase (GGDEF)-like protein/PAS domain S-box-containing protein